MKIETNYVLAASYLPFVGKIQKSPETKEIFHEIENGKVKEILDEGKQKVQPIYNSQGKVIGHDGKGRRLDVVV